MAELKLEELQKKLVLLNMQKRTPEIVKQVREIKKMIARQHTARGTNG